MKKRIAAIVVALVVALFGVGAVVSYAHSADNRAVAGQQVKRVYIAEQAVPKGTTAKAAVDQGLITLQEVVAKGVPAGAMTGLDPARDNLVALGPIKAGEMVMISRFGTKAQTQPTVNGVPSGKVAVTMTLGVDAAVAPLIVKGSHIAIYDTFNARDPKAKQPIPAPRKLADDQDSSGVRATSVVLPDVQVLVVGSSAAGGSKGSTTQSSSSSILVTVAVSPSDSVTLIQAIQTGSLWAGLLGSGTTVNPSVTSNDTNVVKY